MDQSTDKRTFVCPHGKLVTAETKFGVLVYVHKGGSQCDYLNRFGISNKRIMSTVAKRDEYRLTKKTVLAGFRTDRNVRVGVYKSLESMDVEEIEEALTILIKMFRVNISMTAIHEEMKAEFGGTFIRNVKVVLGQTLLDYDKTMLDNEKPRFKMVDISRTKTKASIDSIKNSMDRGFAKRRATLKGISADDDFSQDDLSSLMDDLTKLTS